MTWDPDKYKEKREKVLGVRRRTLSFGVLAILVAMVILLSTGALALPGAISYIKTRHLDDAIYRLGNNEVWPKDLVQAVGLVHGVAGVSLDTHGTRLVVTFDRRHGKPDRFESLFKRHNLETTMLNQVSHRQRLATLAEEKEAEGETP